MQVRYAACVCARRFLLAAEGFQDEYFPAVLPHLCFNRYDSAEGVRYYSLDTWRLVARDSGPLLVAMHIDQVGLLSAGSPSWLAKPHKRFFLSGKLCLWRKCCSASTDAHVSCIWYRHSSPDSSNLQASSFTVMLTSSDNTYFATCRVVPSKLTFRVVSSAFAS